MSERIAPKPQRMGDNHAVDDSVDHAEQQPTPCLDRPIPATYPNSAGAHVGWGRLRPSSGSRPRFWRRRRRRRRPPA